MMGWEWRSPDILQALRREGAEAMTVGVKWLEETGPN